MQKEFAEKYIELRRKNISSYFGNLNDKQKEAVLATEGPLLILAGAGSGKTTVLINRIANLIKFGRAADSNDLPFFAEEKDIAVLEQGGEEALELCKLSPVQPWRILAITFTNKAADELKNRLANMLGESADDIWACTFHSACVKILRREAETLGYPSSFSIYDTNDSVALIKHVMKDLDIDEKTFQPKSVLAEISSAKDALVLPEEYVKNASDSRDFRAKKLAQIYERYQSMLFNAGAMDFDDLILNTVLLLQNNEESREYWQNRFDYVMIDEYQDTNHLQYLFASLMAGIKENICVVGDDDQSIYKFRGATIENILGFEDEYRSCRTIKLEQNYRSTSHILDAANEVIKNNMGRKGKNLWTDKGEGDKIQVYVASDESDEARYVAGLIMSSVQRGSNWRDHAVLYRMNAQSNQMEIALKRSGIPYKVYGGMKFFDRAEIKDILAYLCVIAVPSDDLRLTRIINSPPRGIGQKSVETAAAIAAECKCSLYEVVSRAEVYPELSRSKDRMKKFAETVEELRETAKNQPMDILFDELIEKTGYIRALEEKNTLEDNNRIENVKELKSTILSFMKDNPEADLAGFLADIALYTDLDNYDSDGNEVVLMTMHSSKGLEFDNVYIIGMEETIFPGMRAIGEQDEMEEERRLCYVAITRAREKLHFVSARQRMLFGRTTANKVSRFVEEIDDEHLQKKNLPRSYSYSNNNLDYVYSPKRTSYISEDKRSKPPVKHSETAPAPALELKAGDTVKHKVFGDGVIVKTIAMGGDFLLEINFSKTGTKKLMLKAASAYMEKT